MAKPNDNPCSSSSEDDEYSDPLEEAASAGGRLKWYYDENRTFPI